MSLDKKVEKLLEKDCYVIDFLPEQVPRSGGGQYFQVEQFFLEPEEQKLLYQKFLHILLKLNCYYDFQICFHGAWHQNPEPAVLADWIYQCIKGQTDGMNIILEAADALFVVNGGDLHLSLYHPDEKLRHLAEKLTLREGLFLWRGIE